MEGVGRTAIITTNNPEVKETNLLSLVDAYNNMEEALLSSYLEYFQISLKRSEFNDLKSLVQNLTEVSRIHISRSSFTPIIMDCFYVGYSIPQISKQFDLLRFGEKYHINIELKSTSTPEKIIKQLRNNYYHLSFLDKEIFCFTFVTDENKVYKLNENNELLEVNFEEIFKILLHQKFSKVISIDSLFNPSNYLVSPFNSTDKFINGNYFLTDQQENIKKEALKLFKSASPTFISISGKAGTGKTLLTYDIVKDCIGTQMKVLIIHCGITNYGHFTLQSEHSWDIIPIKSIRTKILSSYSLIVVDEVQRIYPQQLNEIIAQVKDHNLNCIFSFDGSQCLTDWELNNNIEESVKLRAKPFQFTLTEKIRTNKEIASFIRCFFDKSKSLDTALSTTNIKLHYFKSPTEANSYISSLIEQKWTFINYTPDKNRNYPYEDFKVSGHENAHEVIGQEFDKVIAIVDSHFYYNNKKKLSVRGYAPYYLPDKMLFQIVTRTRRKLCVIVIDNIEIMERCLNILNSSKIGTQEPTPNYTP